MEPGAGGDNSPRKPPPSYPDRRFQNLSLIDSISYLLLAPKLFGDIGYAQPATPANGLLQSGPARDICETKAAARRVWTAGDKSNKLKVEEPAASSAASASASHPIDSPR